MRRHDLDLVSLITGVVFVLVAVAHLVGAATGDALDPLWLAPVLLIGLGVAGLAGALRGVGPSVESSVGSSDDQGPPPV